jgi:flagellar L-ring protein precursor FlgH
MSRSVSWALAIMTGGLVLAACDTIRDIGRAPAMTQPNVTPAIETRPIPRAVHETTTPQSTWSDRSADLFRDARAIRPGDILTVKISIKDRATFTSSANRSRDARYGSDGSFNFGLKAFGGMKAGDGSFEAGAGSKSTSEGRGAVSRTDTMDLLVAATVVEILPNGNLLITGNQEVRVNFEMRVLNIDGIVRPRDIATDNSVSYEKIAEARVSYGGRGRSMDVQQPPIGQQIMDVVAPF